MSDKLDLLNDKVNLIYDIVKDTADDIKEVRTIQTKLECNTAANTNSLIEHMKRTELLEKRVDEVEKPIIGKKYLLNILLNISIFLGIIIAVFTITNHIK